MLNCQFSYNKAEGEIIYFAGCFFLVGGGRRERGGYFMKLSLLVNFI